MRTLVITVFCVLLPAAASACVADPTKSTYQAVLVGNSSGHEMGNAYHVVVRDVGNVPLAGQTVTIRFLQSPSRPYGAQDAGTTADCAAGTLSQVSNGNGEVIFYARVAGFDDAQVVEVRANGVLFGHVSVRSTDLDGDGATDLADLNLFRQRYLWNSRASETDFNQDGMTNIADFALFRAEYVRGARTTVCP